MKNNLLYFDKNSRHVEVREFNRGKYEFKDLIQKLLGNVNELKLIGLIPTIYIEDFEFPDGYYVYIACFDKEGMEDPHITLIIDNESFVMKGPLLILKLKIDENKDTLDMKNIVPFTAREINTIATWFSMAFILQPKGKEVLYGQSLFNMIVNGDMAEMDEFHEQKVIQI